LTEVEFPEKLRFLFERHRTKVLYGGRGGIKSWSMARALVLMASERHLRWLCARELMKSLAESVHHLLEMQINLLGLSDAWRIEKGGIYGPHESEFAFTGLRDAHNLKSFEDFDGVWVEEAANVSKRSWDLLLPTIRKPNSEVWIGFNPELDTDETYKRFVLKPPPGAVVVKTSYRDNIWLTDELKAQIEHCKATDPDAYLTIWGGHCKQTLDGAIYAKELREATQAGRICRVPYNPLLPVHTFWDLGYADHTSIWFVQHVAFEYRFIDFYQNSQQALPHYLKVLQERGYVYGTDHLPHDARAKQLGTGKSIEELMRAAGRRVKIVPSISITDGINAVRSLFPLCWFDEEKTAEGMNALRRYCYAVDPVTRLFSKVPLHNDASHPADGIRYTAVGLRPEKIKPPAEPRVYGGPQGNPYGFMG
jgi:phage terminase large subunit